MTPKQQMMIDYLDGKITNVEIIEAWDRQREQNKRYREAIDKIMECVNEHLSDGTEINPYKIDDIVDELEQHHD